MGVNNYDDRNEGAAKLARAQQYASIEEALSQILDDSEGAGLGLIIVHEVDQLQHVHAAQ